MKILFAGPSCAKLLPGLRANPAFELRGPAAYGDVARAVLDGASAIGIIDGRFEDTRAVWHKEILFALESGIPVYGASSMGALRAAELHTFGMIGIGRVFERYRCGATEDDDEVAVVHAPAEAGYLPLSDAMVNIRDGLAAALDEGVIDRREHDTLIAVGKSLFYPDRLWARIAADSGLNRARMDALLAWTRRTRPNAKRDDAIAVLERARDDLHAGITPAPAAFELERSTFWEQLVESVGSGQSEATADAVTAWARLRGPPAVAQAALVRHLARSDARRLGLAPDPQALQAALDDFRRQRALLTPEQFIAWLAAAGLDMETLTRLIADEVLLNDIVSSEAASVDLALIDELKLAGQWGALSEEAAAQGRAASKIGVPSPTPADAGIDEATLLAWYAARFRPVTGELSAHARALGFAGTTDLMVAMTRAYLAERS